MSMSVGPGSGCVRRPRPMRVASTDVTGSEECQECGGAEAGVSILGLGQRGPGQLSIGKSALLCFAVLAHGRVDWLESMVNAVSLLEMACSTFMVIALTRAFWRPSAKVCERTGLVFPVIMCLGTKKST